MSWFKDNDFRKMRWKAHKAKVFEDIGMQDVTEIKRVKTNRFRVACYFAYMYDANSPLPRRIQDIKERKATAAKLAGFDLTLAEDNHFVTSLYALQNDVFVSVVTQMLKLQHNRDFSRIAALENYFNECVEKMFALVEESDKMDTKKMLDAMTVKDSLRKYMKSTSEELEGLYAKIYGDDKQLEETVQQKMSWSPELVADLTSQEVALDEYEDDVW